MPGKGQHLSDETKAKLRKVHLGVTEPPRSDSFRQKVSELAKIRWANPEFKARMLPILKANSAKGADKVRGEKRSPECCLKHSELSKKQWQSGSYAQEKVKSQLRARNRDPEFLKLLSETRKTNWKDPKYRESVVKAVMKACYAKPNKAESYLMRLLDSVCPGQYEFTGNGRIILNGMCPDFTNMNGQKKVVEMFGTYWHQGENPQVRIGRYAEVSYKCLVIWEHELKDREAVTEKIIAFEGT